MLQQEVDHFVRILSSHGVKHAIISPGSRNAPLTIALARNTSINCHSISDERSAAFIAMGMAQSLNEAVILCCTSGSASLNYAPAIAEAFFQNIPLIILTADRPPEWIDQWDGQTIRQESIYGKHVLASYSIPVDLSHPDAIWHGKRIINEAALKATVNKAPVHINVPFREPFYPSANYSNQQGGEDKTLLIESIQGKRILDHNQFDLLQKELKNYHKIAILLGQDQYDADFLKRLSALAEANEIPIFADAISNAHGIHSAIKLCDTIFLDQESNTLLENKPDLIISFGKSIISKNLKLYLRKNLSNHWHVEDNLSFMPDPFQALTKNIEVNRDHFLKLLESSSINQKEFFDFWCKERDESERITTNFFNHLDAESEAGNEFGILQNVLKKLPQSSILHVANSLSIRYVNFIGLGSNIDQIFVNRGTSGIDGSTSTALGHAISTSDKKHFLITGDVAFFYDRNAHWNTLEKHNLKVILLNNKGGSIFRMIQGPSQQRELEEFFETQQNQTAEFFCKENNLSHYKIDEETFFSAKNVEYFLNDENGAVLEIITDSKHNQKIFNSFKNYIKNGLY